MCIFCCGKTKKQSSSSALDRTARALREEFVGYFSFSRIAVLRTHLSKNRLSGKYSITG